MPVFLTQDFALADDTDPTVLLQFDVSDSISGSISTLVVPLSAATGTAAILEQQNTFRREQLLFATFGATRGGLSIVNQELSGVQLDVRHPTDGDIGSVYSVYFPRINAGVPGNNVALDTSVLGYNDEIVMYGDDLVSL